MTLFTPDQAPKRHLDALSLAMALLPLLPIGIDVWGIVYYRQGTRNEMMSLAASTLVIAVVLSVAIAGLMMRGFALTRRSDPRALFTWLLLPLVMMGWPAMCAMRPMPIDMYRRGLAEWARQNVDVAALRAWHASLPAVSAPQKLWPSAAPPAVTKLQPSLIEQHPGGVMLQWGVVALMPGRQRKLFVAGDESVQPPVEGRRFWVQASPGVFIGAHGRS